MSADPPDSLGQKYAAARNQLCLLLLCLPGRKTADRSRNRIEERVRADGGLVLDCTIVQVNAKHMARAHDPHRVLLGTLVPAMTWGLFGLVLGSHEWLSAIIWAAIGAVCGGLFSYYLVTRLPKKEWSRIGAGLPADSSALALFVESADVQASLNSIGSVGPSTATAVRIADDLVVKGYSVPATDTELPTSQSSVGQVTPVLSMAMVRYATEGGARDAAIAMSERSNGSSPKLVVELIVEGHRTGRLHVIDPKYGTRAWARSDVLSWGLFGVAVGLVSGLVSGGLFGAVDRGFTTGVIWAAFGLFAGCLYGLWAGRAVSGRRARIAERLVPPESSILLAWSDQPITQSVLAPFAASGSRSAFVSFRSTATGAVVEPG